MSEQPKTPEPERPETHEDTQYPQDRTEREMGTHEGGKNRPPHHADELHGDFPSELPPVYEGR